MAAPLFENIPEELKARRQWVLWKQITRAGKPTKVPYQPNGIEADSPDLNTWSGYVEIVEAYQKGGYDGIGFVFDPLDPYAGVDLDKCLNEDGSIKPKAKAILDKLYSDSEISPSRTGVKVFLKAKLPVAICKEGGKFQQGFKIKLPDLEFEVYYGNRFFTLTGNKLTDYPATIEDRNEELTEIFKELFKDRHYFDGEQGPRPQREHDEKVEPLSPDAAERLQELFEVDPGFKDELYTPVSVGKRSDAEFHLCARLWEAGFNENEIYTIMISSPQNKWLEREGGGYRWDTIRNAVAKAEASHKKKIDEERTTVEEILTKIKADPRAIKDHAVLKAMAVMRAKDPIEYDLLLESIKKAGTGIKVATINELVDKCVLESKKATEKIQDTPTAIMEKARAITERGDPLRYLVWQAQRNHLGDIDYQKVLICSIASAASLTSNGIQPGGTGEKGSGKSDACTATYHLVPVDRRLDGSLSPMSLFYLQEKGRLKPGMVLFSDDVEYEPIIPIYKRATARFQHGITHFTVSGGKTREALELNIPPRMVWWLTAVESVANEQAFDRQYPISTDSNPDHKKRVSREIAARRARKELRLTEDEGIEVARAIISDIFDDGPFKVLIPQAKEAKWLKVADFRGQEQFWDLVDALVILRWRQRRKDEDGWLVADDQDLIEAKEILSGHKVAHFSDLTEAEAKVVGVMTDGHSKTQKQLTEALEIAQSTLSARLTSIMAKSAIITEDYELGKKVYSINPKMQLGTDYWANLDLIDIKIDSIETYRSQQIALSGCYRYVIGIPIGIIINNSSRIPSSLSVDKQVCIEKGYPCDDCERCPLRDTFLLYAPAKRPITTPNPQQEPLLDTDKTPKTEPIRTDNDSSGLRYGTIRQPSDAVGDIEADLLRAEAERAAREQHFRTPGKKIIPLRFLIDFTGYKKDDVVGIEAQGDLSARPGICELISCGQCPTAIRGTNPICDPCDYLGKGRAEA